MSLKSLISFLLILFPKIISIENCKSETLNQCTECEEGYVLQNNNCNKCNDSYCKYCLTTNLYSCFQCKENYILKGRVCGEKCQISIDHCDLCEPNTNNCIFCNSGCDVDKGKCSCKARKILIILLVIMSIVIIAIVLLCLIKVKQMRNLKFTQFIYSTVDPEKKNDRESKNYYNKNLYIIKNEESPINVNELDNNNNIDKNNNNDEEPNKIKSNDLIDNDITGSNILLKKKICDYCLIENGIIQLSCGCYLCSKHKDLGLGEKCPVCKKEINLID
jgi:hypothetical protein